VPSPEPAVSFQPGVLSRGPALHAVFMIIREIFCKTILTRTGIEGFDYAINPYRGCGHGCRYCYASFMKRFSGHNEPWGEFVDVKINAAEVLKRQLRRAREISVIFSSVTDPYQPVERRYELTRRCLEVLQKHPCSVHVLTRSPLCLRDLEIFKSFERIEVGLSVTTDDERMRRLFEPHSSSIPSRIETLRVLHREGVRTYGFIGPMLPLDPERLVALLEGCVDEVLIDRLNYSGRVKGFYRRAGLDQYLEDGFFSLYGRELKRRFEEKGIPVSLCF